MKTLLASLFIVLVAMMGMAALLVSWFGLPGFLGLVVAMLFGLMVAARLVPAMLRRALVGPFLAKGKVLAHASVEVHSVVPASPLEKSDEEAAAASLVDGRSGDYVAESEDNEADDEALESADAEPAEEPAEPRAWYRIDMTVTPQESSGSFRHWEPSELAVVAHDARSVTLANMDGGEMDGMWTSEDTEIWRSGRWVEDDLGKYEGPQRVRILVGVPERWTRGRFRYYFEVFGAVELPAGETIG